MGASATSNAGASSSAPASAPAASSAPAAAPSAPASKGASPVVAPASSAPKGGSNYSVSTPTIGQRNPDLLKGIEEKLAKNEANPPTPTKPVAKETPAETPKVSQDLMDEFKEYGGTDDELNAFATDEALKPIVRFMRSKFLATPAKPDAPAVETPKAAEKPPAVAPAKIETPVEGEPADLNEADYDPEIIQTVKYFKNEIRALKDALKGVAPLKEHFETTQKQHVEERQNRFTKEVDEALDAMTTHADLFGTGDHTTIQDEKMRGERSKVFKQVVEWYKFYQGQGKQTPPLKTLVNRAVDEIHRDRTKDLARQEILNKVRDHTSGRFVARPVNRTPAAPTDPRAALVKAVQEKLEAKR